IHAADGYARSTGKVGVCFATSGPGATNLITGIANAYMDSVPLVVFTGQVATNLVGTDSFQEIDVWGTTVPLTKHNYLVKNIKDLPNTIKEAFHIARTGRPGPVLVDLPIDILNAEDEFVYPEEVDLPGYKPTYKGHPKQINALAKSIANSQRPVILAGGGVINSGASEQLKQLAELCHIPVAMTLQGLGSFPAQHDLCLGMAGMHGIPAANIAITECDLLIALGSRFANRVTANVEKFAPKAKVVHVDIDPAEIGKNVAVHIPIVGDIKNVLEELLPKLKPTKREKWLEKVNFWKRTMAISYRKQPGIIKPQQVIELLAGLVQEDAIITTEVGQHQMWTAQIFPFSKPRTLISSGGLGSMGFGFPAAIGAQLANPARQVIAICGDGSFQMNCQEMATAFDHKLPLTIIILNNKSLGMVRQLQEFYCEGRYSQISWPSTPDFVKLAEAFGAQGKRVETVDELEPALNWALNNNQLTLLDILVDQEENVLPMVLTGKGINEMIGGWD
ncbi:MAG TPA: biosynthetic-type acetolactate synthase large subunit, partial [Clostridia bacterium]|nr:biosynthetic-type acetolactate synthase large subunit [Clostridia bacterium]